MCGLSGFIGKPGKLANTDKLRILILINETRGKDSTGMFGNRLMRQAEPASVFLQDANFDSIAKANVVLCHTRYGTGGSKTKENAHPFITYSEEEEGKEDVCVVGTHNGWFVNSHEIEKKFGLKDEVDSRLMYRVMAKTRNKKAFENFEGPAALVYTYNGVPHMYKRDSRPLFIAEDKDGWYYSSIEASLYMAGLNVVKEVVNDILFRFERGKIIGEQTASTRLKFEKDVNTYNWKTGVSNELVEELTGEKKYQSPVNHLGHITKATEEKDISKKIALEIMKNFGEKLSVVFKECYIHNCASVQKYTKLYNGHELAALRTSTNSFDKEELSLWENSVKDFTAGIAINKSVCIYKTEDNKNERTSVTLKVTGYSETFLKVMSLDVSKFFFNFGSVSSHFTFSAKDECSESTQDIEDMFKGSPDKIVRTLTLYPKFIKGVQYRCFGVELLKGKDNKIEFFINLDSTLEIRNVAAKDSCFFKNDKDNPIKDDFTFMYSMKDKNKVLGGSGQMGLPFLVKWEEYDQIEPTGAKIIHLSPRGSEDSNTDDDKKDPPHRGFSRIKSTYQCVDECGSGPDKEGFKPRQLDNAFGLTPSERTVNILNHCQKKIKMVHHILSNIETTIDAHCEDLDHIVYSSEYFGMNAMAKFVKQSISALESSRRVSESILLKLEEPKQF